MCIPSSNSESEEEPANNSEAPLVYGDMPAFGDFPETDENLIAHALFFPTKMYLSSLVTNILRSMQVFVEQFVVLKFQ